MHKQSRAALWAILREHEIPLPDEALEAVSGGMVWEMKTSI